MAEPPSAFAIRDVSLVDGRGGPAVPGQAVIVEGTRISWIGPPGQLAHGDRLTVVEGQGRSLLPGLINCHVHLCHDGSPDLFAQARADSPTTAALRGFLTCSSTLQSGVTTVRDCGAAGSIAIELSRAVETAWSAGPRLRGRGRVITMTGGHGHFIGREADGADAVRAATGREMKEGAHFIKAMATGGVLTPASPRPRPRFSRTSSSRSPARPITRVAAPPAMRSAMRGSRTRSAPGSTPLSTASISTMKPWS